MLLTGTNSNYDKGMGSSELEDFAPDRNINK